MPFHSRSLNQKIRNLLLGGLLLISLPTNACPCAFDASSPHIAAAKAAMQNKDFGAAKTALQNALKYDKNNPNIIYNLALVYLAMGNYAEAKTNMMKALEVLSSTYGDEHRQVAQSYMELGDLFENESYDTKQPELLKKTTACFSKSISLCEKIYADVSHRTKEKGKEHSRGKDSGSKNHCQIDPKQAALDLSAVLRHAADFYATDDDFKQAEPMYERSLQLEQEMLGVDNKDVYTHKANLARLYCEESKHDLALPLFKEALSSSVKDNPDSHQTVQILYGLGNLYREQEKLQDAETSFRQAFDVLIKHHQKDEMEIAENGAALSEVLDQEGKPEQAKEICETVLGRLAKSDDKQALLVVLKQYHKHFLRQHKKDEADRVASQIKSIQSLEKTE